MARAADVTAGRGDRLTAAELVSDGLARRRSAYEAWFGSNAESLARCCHAMAERFARGGRLLAIGSSPTARSDVRHVAVEFVHPVIVGKRALPALGLVGDCAPLEQEVRLAVGADDIVMAFGRSDDVRLGVRAGRAAGALTVSFEPVGADTELLVDDPDPFVCQELVETAYHVLWELVHVFFEHRGLLSGRSERRSHDAGAASFLYPFLSESEDDLEAVLADVAGSAALKARDTCELRDGTLSTGETGAAGRATLLGAAAKLRDALARGGRLLALGNGGSATDAADLVADFASAPAASDRRSAPAPGQRSAPAAGERRGWPALDLTADPAILTAIANDIGVEAIFSRQLIAYGRPGDVLVALSTSGSSESVLDALAQARRQEIETVALVGYDGGRVVGEGLADHVIVAPSQHIPRIQEAHATAYHLLCELVAL